MGSVLSQNQSKYLYEFKVLLVFVFRALTLQTPEENQVTKQGVKGKMMNLLLMILVGEQQEEKHIAILQNLADQRDGNTSAALNNAKKAGQSSGRRVPAERIPRSNWRSFDNGGIQSSDPNGNYQQRCKNKDDETASAVPYVRATSRKTDSDSLEPRRSTYVFYRTVNAVQGPKFGGSTAAPEPYGGKCSKPKNQLDTNRRFSTQTESYGNAYLLRLN
ncbi:hypothetical protein Q9233_017191 [Columba guinea]|nr:hypothetical protein Q9233_017191 [Columba guinea]